jgi:hypothetical protein
MRGIPPVPSLDQVRTEPIPWLVRLLLFGVVLLGVSIVVSAFLG